MKRLTHFLGICCLILAFIWHPKTNGELRFGKDILFILLASVSFLSFGVKRSLPIALLILYSGQIDIYSGHALFQLAMVIFGLILFAQVYSIGIKSDIFENYLLALGIIQALWFIGNYFNFSPQHYIDMIIGPSGRQYVYSNGAWVLSTLVKQPVVGSLGQHTISAIYFILALPMAIKRIWPLAIIIPALFICNSTMVQLSCIICAISYYVKNTKILLLPLTMSISLFLVNLKYNYSEWLSGQGRVPVWLWSIKNTKLFGNGLGHLSDSMPSFGGEVFQQVHNEYLELVYVYGLIIVPMLCYVIFKVVNSKHSLLKCSLIGLLFNASGNFSFHISAIAIIGIILIAENLRDEREFLL